MNKFYWESVGEVVNQVYEIEAADWDAAKKAAFADMKEGDRLAECPPSGRKTDEKYPEYAYIDESACENYATLQKGTWATRQPSGAEYWESRAWYFSDADDVFLNGNGEEFTAWETDEDSEG